MKKSIPISLIVFTSFIFLIFVFAILINIFYNAYISSGKYNSNYQFVYDEKLLSMCKTMNSLSFVSQIVMIISTFVVSIIGLSNLKKLTSKNGLAKSTFILSLVISSISIVFSFIAFFATPFIAWVIIIGFIVCFGLSIGSYCSLKKNNQIIDLNKKNNSVSDSHTN